MRRNTMRKVNLNGMFYDEKHDMLCEELGVPQQLASSSPNEKLGWGSSYNKTMLPYSYDPIELYATELPKKHHGEGSVDSDRLFQWDPDKYNRCTQAVWGNNGQYFHTRTPAEISRFLSLYFETKVKLTGVKEWCNHSSGYPGWNFHFVFLEPQKETA